MKVRLTEPGYTNLTGQWGQFNFVDGVTVENVTERDFMRLSAVMKCEREDGTTEAPIDALLNAANTPAPMGEEARAAELDANAHLMHLAAQPEADKPRTSYVDVSVQYSPAAGDYVCGYTEAELAEIADKQGIKGLRAIAEPLGIKGASIKELIADILKGPKIEA